MLSQTNFVPASGQGQALGAPMQTTAPSAPAIRENLMRSIEMLSRIHEMVTDLEMVTVGPLNAMPRPPSAKEVPDQSCIGGEALLLEELVCGLANRIDYLRGKL